MKDTERKSPSDRYGKGFNLKDNTQASPVKGIDTYSEKYDLGRCKYYSAGTKGYPKQAIQGDSMKY